MADYDPNAVAPAGQIGPPGTEESSSALTKVLVLGGLGVLGYYIFFSKPKSSGGGSSPGIVIDDEVEVRKSGKHTILFVDKDDEDMRDFVITGSLSQAISRAKKAWPKGADRALIYPGDHASVGIDAEVYRTKSGKLVSRKS